MTPQGREPRAAFWPAFAPYLALFVAIFAVNINAEYAGSVTMDIISIVGLGLCTVWLGMLNRHCVKRMHDAGVSAFFYGMLFYIMALVTILKIVVLSAGMTEGFVLAVADWGLYAFISVLHVAMVAFTCLPTQAGENEFGPVESHPGVTFTGTSWGGIVEDMLKLILIMGILGYACDLIKRPFAKPSETDTLVTLMRKGGDASESKESMDTYIKELNSKAADFVNTKDANGRSLLMWTVYVNYNDPSLAIKDDASRAAYVELLLSREQIDVAATDEDGFTALHWAAWSGLPQCADLLIAKAPQLINVQDANGYTPLMLAAMRGNPETVAHLLADGADMKLTNKDGKTALDLAIEGESAYSKRESWAYELVFAPARLEAYRATLDIMKKAPAAPAPVQQ